MNEEMITEKYGSIAVAEPEQKEQVEIKISGGAFYRFVKRAFDILSSGLFLLCFGWVILLLMFIKYAEDFGAKSYELEITEASDGKYFSKNGKRYNCKLKKNPNGRKDPTIHGPIYTSDRCGKDGKVFKLHKIRSMCPGAEAMRRQLIEYGINEMDGPPFGHLGEDVIREWFENNLGKLFYNEEERRIFRAGSSDGLHRNIREILGDLTQDFECFDGNAQTFRTVAKLERLGNMPYGMSLSFPLLATIIKYPNGSEPAFGNGIHKKKGTYYAEKGLYDQIQKELHLDHSRHPLAFLLEAADDIAYYTADLEDAGKKRLISSDCFLSAYDAFLRKIENDESGDVRNPAYLQKMKSLREEFDIIMKKDGAELESETTIMKRFMLQARGMLISGVKIAFREHYDSIMKGELTESLLDVSDCKTIKNFLQKMLFDKVYYCKEIIRNKIEAQKIISGLLSVLTESSVNAPEKPEDKTDYLISSLISLNYRKVFSDSQNTDDFDAKLYLYNKILMVLDTIAGMTDSFAKEVYELVR